MTESLVSTILGGNSLEEAFGKANKVQMKRNTEKRYSISNAISNKRKDNNQDYTERLEYFILGEIVYKVL